MKIEITTERGPWLDNRMVSLGEVVECDKDTAKALIDADMAKEVKATRKRARNANGTLKADDPSTPNINEAYE